MPTVATDEETKKYLDMLRKRVLSDRVPTLKETIEVITRFIKHREKEFLDWAKEYYESSK